MEEENNNIEEMYLNEIGKIDLLSAEEEQGKGNEGLAGKDSG